MDKRLDKEWVEPAIRAVEAAIAEYNRKFSRAARVAWGGANDFESLMQQFQEMQGGLLSVGEDCFEVELRRDEKSFVTITFSAPIHWLPLPLEPASLFNLIAELHTTATMTLVPDRSKAIQIGSFESTGLASALSGDGLAWHLQNLRDAQEIARRRIIDGTGEDFWEAFPMPSNS